MNTTATAAVLYYKSIAQCIEVGIFYAQVEVLFVCCCCLCSLKQDSGDVGRRVELGRRRKNSPWRDFWGEKYWE